MNSYFYEVFENIPRQGPGIKESTYKAYNLIKEYLPSRPEILDVGCGKGVQTIELAQECHGHITAIDKHQFFLDHLKKAASEEGLSDKISCINADMAQLPFNKPVFDVIWSEGAVFIIGIKEGLKQWKRFLKQDGFLVLSDLVWLTDERPSELTQHWKNEGISVLTIDQVLKAADQEKYCIIDHFTLPDEGWLEKFIIPLEKTITSLRAKYAGNTEALETFQALEYENGLVKKYLNCCGYEFFIWKY